MVKIFNRRKTETMWESGGMIPLGAHLDNQQISVFMKTHSLAENTLVFARPGVGKSVITRNIYAMYWMFGLPLVIFDPTGSDHRLNYNSNSYPINIAPGIRPFGMSVHPRTKKIVKYLAVPQAEINCWEDIYKPNLQEFNLNELISLGFSTGAGAHLQRILKTYGPFEDYDDLVEFVEKFPANTRAVFDAQKKLKRGIQLTNHHTQYKINDSIPSSSKENLQKTIYKLKEESMIALDDANNFDAVSWINDGNSVIYSFDEHYALARAVVSSVARKLIQWKKTKGKFKNLGFGFEEMDKTFVNDATGEMSKFISTLILQLRKRSIKIIGSSATIVGVDENLIENSHNIIFGQMEGRHIKIISSVFGKYIAERVKSLKWNRFAMHGGYREFLLKDEQKRAFPFVPYECPCEMHREVMRKIK
jgi:hypothetical protein